MSKGGNDVEMPKPEDYIPLVNAQAQANKVNQYSPFGSLTYNTTYNDPLDFNTWSSQNQSLFSAPKTVDMSWKKGGSQFAPSTKEVDPTKLYSKYLKNFDKGIGDTTATFDFSPEGQSLFDKQFDPNSYDNYSQDYMDRYSALIQPDRDYAVDRFEQRMFDRGQPVGGEEYGDKYRQTIGDPFARQDIMAAQAAAGAADAARLQDYNRLASALGLTTLPVPQTDVTGPANMAMNANIQNAQNANQQSSNLWNSAAMLGGAYLMGNPFGGSA